MENKSLKIIFLHLQIILLLKNKENQLNHLFQTNTTSYLGLKKKMIFSQTPQVKFKMNLIELQMKIERIHWKELKGFLKKISLILWKMARMMKYNLQIMRIMKISSLSNR